MNLQGLIPINPLCVKSGFAKFCCLPLVPPQPGLCIDSTTMLVHVPNEQDGRSLIHWLLVNGAWSSSTRGTLAVSCSWCKSSSQGNRMVSSCHRTPLGAVFQAAETLEVWLWKDEQKKATLPLHWNSVHYILYSIFSSLCLLNLKAICLDLQSLLYLVIGQLIRWVLCFSVVQEAVKF